MTGIFQDMILGVYWVHPKHHGWPCPPCLWSGTLNILQVPSFFAPNLWHPSYKDINTKLSGYIPFGQKRSYMTSKITLSAKYLVMNPQCLQLPPFLTPHSLHSSNTDIHTQFSGHLSLGKTRSSMTSRMTQVPVLQVSGHEPSMLNILQV